MQINKNMNECTIEKCIQIVGKQISFKLNLLGIEKKSFESPEMNTGSEMPLVPWLQRPQCESAHSF